jgi:hypothetical protein
MRHHHTRLAEFIGDWLLLAAVLSGLAFCLGAAGAKMHQIALLRRGDIAPQSATAPLAAGNTSAASCHCQSL